ncbi:hypothetical protein BT69DRAFT_1282766 [Atractiella rhizophila]|nr:hypothetical protein BT69DRAFT_1291192 [Atractiella rhizophila]KAH8921955.1 hypothetical protein BT69DRAFT_1282766 [Atractiella rhizophila]
MTAQLAQLRIQNVNCTSASAHRDRARRIERHRPPRLPRSVRVTALVGGPRSCGPSKDASAV